MISRGISVIIPNYNGKDLLEQILPDMYTALNNSGEKFEVIIADDCSTDGSIDFLRQNYPSINIQENDINKGFSPTINKGIFISRYEYLLLLNSDVKLTPDYLKLLFRYFEKEDTFGVMGRIIGWDDDKIQDGGKYPSFHVNKIKTTGNYFPVKAGCDDWMYSMYLSGANAFVSREKLMELKGFNEIFAPFYVEDYDLSLRAWRLGYKCYYEHSAICRHKVSVSINSKSSKKFVNTIYYRNKMFLHAIHLAPGAYYTWYLQNVLEIIFQSIIGKTYYFKAFILFLKSQSKWRKSKRDFEDLASQKNSDLSFKDIMHYIMNSLKNKEIHKF